MDRREPSCSWQRRRSPKSGVWSARDGNEIVFVDRTSIYEVGDLKKARVLRSYSTVQTIGDEAFPHKSEIL